MTADQVSAAAAVITVFVALAAIFVARNQITESRNIARESTATNLYNRCLELSLQYPKLAEPALSGGFIELVKNPNCAACYHWFVASMMLSCEEILAVTKNDKKWRASVSATLDGHADYFRYRNQSDRPLNGFYSEDLVKVVTEIVDNLENPPKALALRMSEKANA